MTTLHVLLIDDELCARQRLRGFLGSEPDIEIIGECDNGIDAVTAIQDSRPDLVFLDMQMPGCDGLQVVARLPASPRPMIIFVTAHERFAVEAFAVQAVDYVLKPFDRERIQRALERVRERLEARTSAEINGRIERLLAGAGRPDRLAVRTDGRIVFLKPAEIVWVEAANNHSILHLTDARRLQLRETLGALEERLGPAYFARVNRSALVRFDQVKELQSAAHGDYVVVLQGGTKLPLSRNLRGRMERFALEPL